MCLRLLWRWGLFRGSLLWGGLLLGGRSSNVVVLALGVGRTHGKDEREQEDDGAFHELRGYQLGNSVGDGAGADVPGAVGGFAVFEFADEVESVGTSEFAVGVGWHF